METVGLSRAWKQINVGFSFGCRHRYPASPRPSRSVQLQDTDKDATPPFIREGSSESSTTWPLFSLARNSRTASNEILKPLPPSQLGNQTVLPAEYNTPSIASFAPLSKGESHTSFQSSSLSPWERALEQVHAILDLYGNNTGHQDSISADVLMTAVKSLIQRQRKDRMALTTSTLCRLEELVWRFQHLGLRLTSTLLEEIWDLQQMDLQKRSQTQQLSRRYCHSLVERQAKLLLCWMQWSQQGQPHRKQETYFDSLVRPPPPHNVLSTLQLAVRANASLYPSLWDLYLSLQNQTGCSVSTLICSVSTMNMSRVYFSSMFRLSLATPSETSKTLQVLQDMERHCQETGQSSYRPTIFELQGALEAASIDGSATEASWSFQHLLAFSDDDDDIEDSSNNASGLTSISDEKVGYWRLLLLQAILRSPDAASNLASVALYAQRLIRHWRFQPQLSGGTIVQPHRDLYHELLKAWASSRRSGAGQSAEAVYIQMVDHNASSLQPQLETNVNRWASSYPTIERQLPIEDCVHQVVLAYLQDTPLSLQNIRRADGFVRKSILARQPSFGHLLAIQSNQTEADHRIALPTIEAILAAYAAIAPSDQRAIKPAERLFRFLLVQHRDGRTNEEPNPTHLQYVLDLAEDAAHGDEICVELFRLVSSLAESQLLSKGPDAGNMCQLLKVMSNSGKPGYGIYAQELFQLISRIPSIPAEQVTLAASHVAQCVQHEREVAADATSSSD